MVQEENKIDITFFMPCYNESENIINAIHTLTQAASQFNIKYEIIIVDDCSKDNSIEIIENFQKEHPNYPITLIKNKINKGLGENYIDTAFRGHGEYYMRYDGDDPHTVEDLATLLKKIGQADMIVPYFGGDDFRSVIRQTISRSYTLIVNCLSGFNLKYYNGLAILKRYDVMRWAPESHGFGFQAELLQRLLLHGRNFVEVKIVNHEKTGTFTSALKFKNFVSVVYSLFKIAMRRLRKTIFGH